MSFSPFVGQISMVGFNFAPTGWAHCYGQLLPISQNTALFSLLGTYYGGDGKSTFALPDFQDRSPMHQGQGAGLSERFLGEMGGTSSVTLLVSEIPSHVHTVLPVTMKTAGAATTANALQALPAASATVDLYSAAPSASDYLAPLNNNLDINTVPMGGSLPHNNMQPYLAINFIIATQGVFPPRT